MSSASSEVKKAAS
ncbi:hypothetical protein VCHC42A1_3480, partial [Vibrio cholerae HC-42A1]